MAIGHDVKQASSSHIAQNRTMQACVLVTGNSIWAAAAQANRSVFS